jgi:anti-sigma factor RsiW
MTVATHPIAPEEIMAMLDGELASAEAHLVSAHVNQCTGCAAIAAEFRATSQSLARWTVPPAPLALDDAVHHLAASVARSASAKVPSNPRIGFGSLRFWTMSGAGVVAAVLALAVFLSYHGNHIAMHPMYEIRATEPPSAGPSAGAGSFNAGATMMSPLQQTASAKRVATTDSLNAWLAIRGEAATAASPMIARTVSLTILVKDITISRSVLDSILEQHHGYPAQLSIYTPENASRLFQASLRIPASGLPAALANLRSLGRVQNETQSGEEVTQQHADLVARLKNARETEERLRAILHDRTGKVEEVLKVEEQISSVRGEIESMEAQQATLEHRVEFATVDLQLMEEYKEQLTSPSTSASTRMHNAFIAGIRNAAASGLGLVLFLAEFGPVILFWVVVLGLPAVLLLGRYRKARARI